MIYLDNAAATPMDPGVRAAMQPYFTEKFYNPSALYRSAQAVSQDLHAARQQVSACMGVRPVEIVFTAGGSEANNLAISGVMAQYPDANIVVSSIEHDSVLQTAGNFDCRIAPVTGQGIIDLAQLDACIDKATVLVSVMYANNEVGTVQPIKDVAALAASIRKNRAREGNPLPLYVHTDAAQAANYLDIHAPRLGVDFMTLNGGKLYGPKQSGALYIRSGIVLRPVIFGGGQERGLRSGTENVAACIGFAEALATAQNTRHDESRRLQKLQETFISLIAEHIPQAVINGSLKKRLPNNVHITIPGQDNERLLFALDEQGIMAAAGSACSASDETSSHVLLAMGKRDADARASLRFTMGRSTTWEDVATTVQAVAALLA
jgi:cysteine desulfurase